MKLAKALLIGAMGLVMLTGASGDGCEPEKGSHDTSHNNPEKPIPNPDPKPPKGTNNSPKGVYVTFIVRASKALGPAFITYNYGIGQKTKVATKFVWGTIVSKGTPVSLLAAPNRPGSPGQITIQIRREPGDKSQGGTLVCGDENGSDDRAVGGAGCAGTA